MNHIKVNFPETREKYLQGVGEGMWVIVDDGAKAAHDRNDEGGTYWGTLDNDSFVCSDLTHGERVLFEMRGDKRPVACWEWLVENHGYPAE